MQDHAEIRAYSRRDSLLFGSQVHVVYFEMEVGREFYGDGSDRCRGWVEAQVGFLVGDKVEIIIRNAEKLRPRTKRQVKVRQTNLGYFQHNRDRMRCGTFNREWGGGEHLVQE